MPSLVSGLTISGLFLCLLGFLAMAEASLYLLRRNRLRRQAREGNRRAHMVLELARDETRVAATVKATRALLLLLVGAEGVMPLAVHLQAWLPSIFPLPGYDFGLYLFLSGVVFSLVVWGVAVVLPRRIAESNPNKVALNVARPFHFWCRLVGTPALVMEKAIVRALNVIGIRPHEESTVSDEEVADLIEEGMQSGAFDPVEKEMVEGVLALDDLPVTAIMTPSPKIVWLNIDDTDDVNWRKVISSGHSQFPVYKSNRDNVLGMVSVKSIWSHVAMGIPANLRNLLSAPLVVQNSINGTQLLETFKKSGKHIALVADEFGSYEGLVTLIDVLEAIVGDLPSFGERKQPEIRRMEDGSWTIDATLGVVDFKDTFGFDKLPEEEEADYQTIGGFVMTRLGRIPKPGDRFEWNGYGFEVLEMDRHRIDRIRLTKIPAAVQQAS